MSPETPKPPLEGEKQSIRDSMIDAAKANNVEYDPTKLKDATPDIKVGLADRWIAKAVNNDPEKARKVYKALGIDIASTDDAWTVERFKKFQIENNLEPDGIPGPRTLEVIDRLTWDNGNFDKQLYSFDGSPYIETTQPETKNENEISFSWDGRVNSEEETGVLAGLWSIETKEQTDVRNKKEELVAKKEEENILNEHAVAATSAIENWQTYTSEDGSVTSLEKDGKTYLVKSEDGKEISRVALEEPEKTKEESDFNNLTQSLETSNLPSLGYSEDTKISSVLEGNTPRNGWKEKEITALKERLGKLVEGNSKMAELSLGQYQKLLKEPESFATSDLIPDSAKKAPSSRGPNNWAAKQETVYVAPESFGLQSDGFEYARNGNAIIKRPKEGADIGTIMIAGPDGKFETQKEWLAKVQVTPGKTYALYGVDKGTTFQKDKDGNVTISEWTVEKSRYEVATKSWKAGEQLQASS
jgi:hypothetical protein